MKRSPTDLSATSTDFAQLQQLVSGMGMSCQKQAQPKELPGLLLVLSSNPIRINLSDGKTFIGLKCACTQGILYFCRVILVLFCEYSLVMHVQVYNNHAFLCHQVDCGYTWIETLTKSQVIWTQVCKLISVILFWK